MATPIGNLGDITLRAADTLKQADLIACEDTRMTARLLSHLGVRVRTVAYHDHNAEQQRPYLLAQLAEGKRIALVSDAGTPLISDPGYKLVRAAQDAGHDVVAVPGPSSLTAALSIAGLPTDRVFFVGFLPAKTKARDDALAAYNNVPATLVCFESAQRLPETLQAMHAILGAREAAVARELTKLHEELRRAPLDELAAHYLVAGAPKGEVVVLVSPPEEKRWDDGEVDALLKDALATLSVKDAAAAVAQITGLPKSALYARALKLKP